MSVHLSSYFTIPEKFTYHNKIFVFPKKKIFNNEGIRFLSCSAVTGFEQKYCQGMNLYLGGLKQQNMSHEIAIRCHIIFFH